MQNTRFENTQLTIFITNIISIDIVFATSKKTPRPLNELGGRRVFHITAESRPVLCKRRPWARHPDSVCKLDGNSKSEFRVSDF